MDVDDLIRAREDEPDRKLEDIIEAEKKLVAEARSVSDLKIVQEAWENNKAVLDQIARCIPRLTDRFPFVNVDFSALKLPTRHIEEVLTQLNKSHIFDYLDSVNKIVVSTAPLRRYLSGQGIIVKDLQRFQDFHKQAAAILEAVKKREESLEAMIMPAMVPFVAPVNYEFERMKLEAQLHQESERRERHQHRDLKKFQRILAEKDMPLKRQVLQTIQSRMEGFGTPDSDLISVDFFYFNYDSTVDGKKLFEKMVDSLISEGYLQAYTTEPYANGRSYTFTGVNREKIVEYLAAPSEPKPRQPKKTEKNASIPNELLAKLARATTWETIRLEFSDDIERVEIFIADERVGEYHFSDLGFDKGTAKRERKAVKSWRMLVLMSMSGGKHAGGINEQKTKRDLQTRLKTLFPTPIGDPIVHAGGYQCRIRLVSKTDARNAFADRKADRRQTNYLRNH